MYAGIGATPDTNALQTEWMRLYNQLHTIAISIGTERQRGNVAGVQALLPRFKSTVDQMNAINRQLYSADFTEFDGFLLSTSQWVQDSLAALPGAIAALPSAVGAGLLRGAIPWVAIGLGYLWFRGKL